MGQRFVEIAATNLAATRSQGRCQNQADLVTHTSRGVFIHKLLVPGLGPLQLLPRVCQGLRQHRCLLWVHALQPNGHQHSPYVWTYEWGVHSAWVFWGLGC